MQNSSNYRRVSIQLKPIELIWLHSQHVFQKIEQNTMLTNNQIRFYKNNNGVDIRFTRIPEDPNYDIIVNAKQQLENMVYDKQIRLMNTSLHKDIYVKISREARKQFPKTYIIFLHYETFENCCRKLKDKFGITSILPELQKLQKDNPFFCFLIAEKSKIQQVQNYTNKILNSEVSCASTTFSIRQKSVEKNNILYKKTMSVSSLRGSFTSFDQPTQIQHCRMSIHNSEDEQEIFQVNEIALVNLNQDQLDNALRNKIYCGCRIHVQEISGNYLSVKKKLYYVNRLQLSANPHIQPIYAYSMKENNLNRWKLVLITDRIYISLRDLIGTIYLHNIKNKIYILVKLAKSLLELHRNHQSYGDIKQQNILFDQNKNIYLSSIIDKKIPPYTNPIAYDIRQYLLITYRLLTEIQISSQCLTTKFTKDRYFCTLGNKCKNKMLKEFIKIADELFIEDITFEEFVYESQKIINKAND